MHTLRHILEETKRKSGRTSNIVTSLMDFLEHASHKNIAVVCHSNEQVNVYLDWIQRINPSLSVFRMDRKIRNDLTHSVVYFVANNEIITTRGYDTKFKGLRLEDVIFDTPELDVYDTEFISYHLPYLASRLTS